MSSLARQHFDFIDWALLIGVDGVRPNGFFGLVVGVSADGFFGVVRLRVGVIGLVGNGLARQAIVLDGLRGLPIAAHFAREAIVFDAVVLSELPRVLAPSVLSAFLVLAFNRLGRGGFRRAVELARFARGGGRGRTRAQDLRAATECHARVVVVVPGRHITVRPAGFLLEGAILVLSAVRLALLSGILAHGLARAAIIQISSLSVFRVIRFPQKRTGS